MKFLGREIEVRQAGEVLMRVAPDYLQELCKDLSPTETPPDILNSLEKSTDVEVLEPLKATEYRSALGRVVGGFRAALISLGLGASWPRDSRVLRGVTSMRSRKL